MTQIDYASAGVLREPWGPVGFRWSMRSVLLIVLVLGAGVWLRLRHSPYTAVTVLPVAPFFMGFHDNERLVTAEHSAGVSVRMWDVRSGGLVDVVLEGAVEPLYSRDLNYDWNRALRIISKDGTVRELVPGRDPMIRSFPEHSDSPPKMFFPLIPHEKYDVVMTNDRPGWRVSLREKATETVWHSVRIAWNWQSLYGFRLSREGRTLAVTGSGKTLFYDMPSETMCATYERGWGDIQFLPSEREFFCFDWLSKAHAVFRVGTAEPIAVLPGVGSSGLCPPAVSPDGRWIACAGQGFGTTILKRTGWDCLPSPAGMLVFPPTWLLAITVAGAAWSLRGDARRVGMKHWLQGAPWLRLINACIFTVLVVLTVHALLMVGVRRTPPTTAAPVLLITWIGLGTGSRVWRMAALVTCAAALAWCGWCLRLEWQLGSGWRGTQRVEMLDRAYMWPRALGMGALVAGAVACGIAVVWLALTMAVSDGRRSRSGVCANAGTWQRTDGLE